MNLRNLSIGFIFPMSLAFGLSGCGKWKPLGHSVGKHYHGSGAK